MIWFDCSWKRKKRRKRREEKRRNARRKSEDEVQFTTSIRVLSVNFWDQGLGFSAVQFSKTKWTKAGGCLSEKACTTGTNPDLHLVLEIEQSVSRLEPIWCEAEEFRCVNCCFGHGFQCVWSKERWSPFVSCANVTSFCTFSRWACAWLTSVETAFSGHVFADSSADSSSSDDILKQFLAIRHTKELAQRKGSWKYKLTVFANILSEDLFVTSLSFLPPSSKENASVGAALQFRYALVCVTRTRTSSFWDNFFWLQTNSKPHERPKLHTIAGKCSSKDGMLTFVFTEKAKGRVRSDEEDGEGERRRVKNSGKGKAEKLLRRDRDDDKRMRMKAARKHRHDSSSDSEPSRSVGRANRDKSSSRNSKSDSRQQNRQKHPNKHKENSESRSSSSSDDDSESEDELVNERLLSLLKKQRHDSSSDDVQERNYGLLVRSQFHFEV